MNFKSQKKLSLFGRFVLVVNSITSAMLLLSYLTPLISPDIFWVIAILGLLYPFLVGLNMLFCIFWLIYNRKFALIPGICILIGFKIIVVNFGFNISSSAKKKGPKKIRIMAYNVRGFVSTSSTSNAMDSILKLINIQQPDIINIEEFAVNVNDSRTIYRSLKSTMKTNYYYVKQYEYTPYDSSGVAIFSKYPIINKGTVFTTPDAAENQAIFVDLKKGTQIFRVYCVHLKSVRFTDKEHVYLKELTHCANVNLDEMKIVKNKLKLAFISRAFQAMTIKKHMEHCPYPCIVAGDFNDTPISYSVNKIAKGLKNGFEEKGEGFGFTYYGDFPNLQIDYIFASKQFNIERYQCINKKISDHYSITSDLLLNP